MRLDMFATLHPVSRPRFSEAALLPRRARPGHRPACRHPQRRSLAREALAVRRRRFTDDRAEGAAEGTEAVEPDVEGDLGDGTVGLAEELHRALHPAALQVAVRRLPEGRAELA